MEGGGGGDVDEECWQAIGKLWVSVGFPEGVPWILKILWFRIIDVLPEILRDVESILIPITDRSDSSGSSWECQIGVTRYVQKSQVKEEDNEMTRTTHRQLWVRRRAGGKRKINYITWFNYFCFCHQAQTRTNH